MSSSGLIEQNFKIMTDLNNTPELSESTNTAVDYSTCYAQPSIQLMKGDCLKIMKALKNESIDIICTDPPYKYLKNQKLETDFDEQLFFTECKRVLTKDGFIVLFGRGVSLFRWCLILDDLKFKFKEEMVWKKQPTSPAMCIGRIHELVMIYSKKNGKINRVRVPAMDKYKYEPDKILEIIKRIQTTFGNRDTFQQLKQYYESGRLEYYSSHNGYGVSLSADNRKTVNRTVQFARGLEEGITEQTIIEERRDHYSTIHPTQKPVRLLERLLALVIPKEKPQKDVVVLDPFGGSFSTMEAVYNMGMKGISCEIDKEFFDLGKKRIEKLPPRQLPLFE